MADQTICSNCGHDDHGEMCECWYNGGTHPEDRRMNMQDSQLIAAELYELGDKYAVACSKTIKDRDEINRIERAIIELACTVRWQYLRENLPVN